MNTTHNLIKCGGQRLPLSIIHDKDCCNGHGLLERVECYECEGCGHNGINSEDSCTECSGGVIIVCIDDLCRNSDSCMHGDGEAICNTCDGEGNIFLDCESCKGKGFTTSKLPSVGTIVRHPSATPLGVGDTKIKELTCKRVTFEDKHTKKGKESTHSCHSECIKKIAIVEWE